VPFFLKRRASFPLPPRPGYVTPGREFPVEMNFPPKKRKNLNASAVDQEPLPGIFLFFMFRARPSIFCCRGVSFFFELDPNSTVSLIPPLTVGLRRIRQRCILNATSHPCPLLTAGLFSFALTLSSWSIQSTPVRWRCWDQPRFCVIFLVFTRAFLELYAPASPSTLVDFSLPPLNRPKRGRCRFPPPHPRIESISFPRPQVIPLSLPSTQSSRFPPSDMRSRSKSFRPCPEKNGSASSKIPVTVRDGNKTTFCRVLLCRAAYFPFPFSPLEGPPC